MIQSSGQQEHDNRSVDELLEFIETDAKSGYNISPQLPVVAGSKKKSSKKSKKKDRKRSQTKPEDDLDKREDIKQEFEKSASNSSSSKDDEEEDDFDSKEDNSDELVEDWVPPEEGLEEAGEEDIDPEMRAVLDREVEEFRQRLESINTQTRTAPKIPLPISAASFVSSLVGVH